MRQGAGLRLFTRPDGAYYFFRLIVFEKDHRESHGCSQLLSWWGGHSGSTELAEVCPPSAGRYRPETTAKTISKNRAGREMILKKRSRASPTGFQFRFGRYCRNQVRPVP